MLEPETQGDNGNNGDGNPPDVKMIEGPPPKKRRRSKFSMRLAEKIYTMAGYGMTDKVICGILDIGEASLHRWKSNLNFRGKLEKAKMKADGEVESALFNRAKGMTVIEKHVEQINGGREDGKMKSVVIERQLPPETQAARLWLVNRSPERWQDKPIHIGDTTINFNADKMAINMAEKIGDRSIAIEIAQHIIRAITIPGESIPPVVDEDMGNTVQHD